MEDLEEKIVMVNAKLGQLPKDIQNKILKHTREKLEYDKVVDDGAHDLKRHPDKEIIEYINECGLRFNLYEDKFGRKLWDYAN